MQMIIIMYFIILLNIKLLILKLAIIKQYINQKVINIYLQLLLLISFHHQVNLINIKLNYFIIIYYCINIKNYLIFMLKILIKLIMLLYYLK